MTAPGVFCAGIDPVDFRSLLDVVGYRFGIDDVAEFAIAVRALDVEGKGQLNLEKLAAWYGRTLTEKEKAATKLLIKKVVKVQHAWMQMVLHGMA